MLFFSSHCHLNPNPHFSPVQQPYQLKALRLKLALLQESPANSPELWGRAVTEIEELDRIIDDVLEILCLQLHTLPLIICAC